jgi:hypothetical protein
MQDEALHRIGQVLPQVEPEALVKEEEALKQERKRALAEDAQGGSKTERAPKVSQSVIGRNELVTITNGSQTQTIKFKKAQGMIATGEWRML